MNDGSGIVVTTLGLVSSECITSSNVVVRVIEVTEHVKATLKV